MRPVKDLVGTRFGRLIVIRRDRNRHRHWVCRCDCGAEKSVCGGSLKNRSTQSCGCWHREVVSNLFTKHGHNKIGKKTPEYFSWSCMIQRCSRTSAPNFKWYGAKGVRVCRRWKDFKNFLEDMGKRPLGTFLSRKNDKGNYEPSNCYWGSLRKEKSHQIHNV